MASFHAMVLSAGYGTRLKPLTDEIPKPLLPVGDRAVLGLALAALKQAGADRLVVNAHHHWEKISKYLDELGLGVQVSREETILGTAGGIRRVRDVLRGAPVIVVNGDIVGSLPVKPLLAAGSSGFRLAVIPRPIGLGTVGLGEMGEVVRLRGQSFGREIRSGDYMGVCLLDDSCLDALPEEGCLMGDYALPLLQDGGTVHTTLVAQGFEDIGTPQDYLRANLNWLAGRGDGQRASYLGEGARIGAGVRLEASVVGAGATVAGEGRILGCLFLPGASARAPLENAIVTPGGRVMSVGGN